jgi:hypothetical protein
MKNVIYLKWRMENDPLPSGTTRLSSSGCVAVGGVIAHALASHTRCVMGPTTTTLSPHVPSLPRHSPALETEKVTVLRAVGVPSHNRCHPS